MNQYIYVVGGYDGSQQLASVERYDTERDTWELVAPVHIARSALSLTVLDNKLYALGEYKQFTYEYSHVTQRAMKGQCSVSR